MQEEYWQKEARFFDRQLEKNREPVRPMDRLAVTRFSSTHLRRRFQKEYRFLILGPLHGKRILDVGCGDGVNSVLLAMLGASVTGVDVSERAIAIARERAAVSGVAERTQFHCSAIETFEDHQSSFDIVWCDSILHHLIPALDRVMRRLAEMTSGHAQFVAYEPINLSRALRRFRELIPIRTEATPDERPLEQADLNLIERHLKGASIRYFALLGRLDRVILSRRNFERSAWARRALVSSLVGVDAMILRLPRVYRFAGRAVIYGHLKP